MKVFISGVMQGSRKDHDVHAQDYRKLLTERIRARHPEAEVIDPWELHPGAVEYTPEHAKQTLFEELELSTQCDVLIAYLPEASMGTALEVWSAYQAGVPVLCISPMARNWVIQSLATAIIPTFDEFLAFIDEGGLTRL
jgi:hypothetical protein